jgi:hypothetical protein
MEKFFQISPFGRPGASDIGATGAENAGFSVKQPEK